MRTQIIRIGNSQGIRIPKTILEQVGFRKEVELEVENDQIIIKRAKTIREGWKEAFQKMTRRGDDKLLNEDVISNKWDEEEWQW
jgi:antitoxin MazE